MKRMLGLLNTLKESNNEKVKTVINIFTKQLIIYIQLFQKVTCFKIIDFSFCY
tara:strand:- start:451 stop:609 length:159 start_codon:yes stop_codon:yes gene_type:complete